jgi:tRNA pseudouridine38-40 synthase
VRRIKLVVQYDGTDYRGWAEQPRARTVSGTLKNAITRATGIEVELRGASRTDSGGHAAGQVADFATSLDIPTGKWPDVINRWLPGDIRVLRASAVPMRFHSRFFARSRTYEYRFAESRRAPPERSRFVHSVGWELDLLAMSRAASLLVGDHDFRAFGEELVGVENSVRRVDSATVRRRKAEVVVRLEASAFIRGMVRRISGGLLEVGRGKRSVEEFENLLDVRRRDWEQWPVVLPARGLMLMKVTYGRPLRDLRDERDLSDA